MECIRISIDLRSFVRFRDQGWGSGGLADDARKSFHEPFLAGQFFKVCDAHSSGSVMYCSGLNFSASRISTAFFASVIFRLDLPATSLKPGYFTPVLACSRVHAPTSLAQAENSSILPRMYASSAVSSNRGSVNDLPVSYFAASSRFASPLARQTALARQNRQ